jgi:ATP-dependent Clp protease adaptor protein ClpS
MVDVPTVSAPPPETLEPRTVDPEVGRATDQASVASSDAWVTVVWNDPVNLMSYVSYVFESYFGYSPERANVLMLQVHHDGRATVAHGGRERMEVDVQAMHDYGLWATLERDATGGA